jgi:FixJ family two-component response regulator
MTTVFLVDDDPGVLTALTRLLRAAGHHVRAFASPHDFLAGHDPAVPGCAVLDVSMPDLDGLELQAALTTDGIERPVIFVTGVGDIPTSVRAIRAGAVDFLTKPVDHAALLAAIDRAIAHDATARRRDGALAPIRRRLQSLTPREREVLDHVVAGRLNKQIAHDLGTVEKTIKVHRGRMMNKLGVRTVADLVRLAAQLGIDARAPTEEGRVSLAPGPTRRGPGASR